MHIFFHRQTNFRQTSGAIFGGEKEKKKGKEGKGKIDRRNSTRDKDSSSSERYRRDRFETWRLSRELSSLVLPDLASLTKTRILAEKDLKPEKFWVWRRLGNTHRPVIRNT